jgi:tetratricopeptide (TPR) repeat protein
MLAGYGAWSRWDAHRVERLRSEARHFTRLAQTALHEGVLSEARQNLNLALAAVKDEPQLADLQQDAQTLLSQVQQQLLEQAARDEAQRNLSRFFELRDEALYHGTLFTGIDLAANVEAAKAAATQALALFAGDTTSPQWRLADEQYFADQQREQIRQAVYELWLILADATAQPLPGKPSTRAEAEEALAALDSAQRLGLTTHAFHLRKAQYLQQAGDDDAARQERQRAAEIAPSTALDHFLVGDALNKEGKVDEAIPHFEQALRSEPDHFWSHYFLAVCRLKQQRFREAVAQLTAALTLQPDFGWTWLLRGYAYGHLDDYASAEVDFQAAQEKGVDDYGLYVNRGVVRIRQGKLDEAAEDMRRAIAARPDQYQAYVNLAVVHRHRGELEQALEQLQRATSLAPQADTPYRARAEVHRERDDLPAALADYDRAVRYGVPGSAALAADQLERGRILQLLKRPQEALAAYDAAAQIDPDAPNLHYLRADALLALRRGDEALAALNRYLQTKAANPDALRLRGFERALRGDSAGALADYTRSLEAEPDSALARARRGWAFLNTAAQVAFEDFDHAIKLDSTNSDLYNGRGFALVMLGKYREGAADAEKALELGPAGAELKEKLALHANAACTMAQAAGRAAQDLSAADHEELSTRYAQRAVALLRQAAELAPEALRSTWLKQTTADPAFDPIRHNEAFRQLLASPSVSG